MRGKGKEAFMEPANQLNKRILAWLQEPDSPGVRYLALRDLCDLPVDDPELNQARRRAHVEGPIAEILAQMQPEGFWSKPGAGYGPKYYSTVWSIIQLAQLGACVDEDERIGTACAYLLDQSLTRGGQFSVNGSPSGTIDCLQGNLYWALLELGFNDPRLESALEWMARTVTGEGLAPASDRQAELRYYAYKCGPNFACGPNNGLPCAWGAVKVMLALGKTQPAKRSPLIQKSIQVGSDFLFSVDPATAGYPSPATGKPNLSWFKFGFPVFYVTDVLQLTQALVSLGFGKDIRLANALDLIRAKQDRDGGWPLEYDYREKTWVNYGQKRKPNKWVTYRALRVLKEA
jgi:hypothetical protein